MATTENLDRDASMPDADEVVQRAHRRWKRWDERESENRTRGTEDLKFANGDADNGYQWDDTLRNARREDGKPTLTINKVRQHNLQITNDARQNKPGIKVSPVSSDATFEAAQVYAGVIRHIEYQSNAQAAYDTATDYQVEAGMGYWRVVTDYADDSSFDQEIFIRRVKDPNTVFLDPDIQELDGSDAKWGGVFEDISHDEFRAKHPGHEHVVEQAPIGEGGDDWINRDTVRVLEYFEVTYDTDELVALDLAGDGNLVTRRMSELPDDVRQLVRDDKSIRRRPIHTPRITWYKIAGHTRLQETQWLGIYIPIVRLPGEERVIDGKVERKGHTRPLKDAQRMYNYWTSSATEHIALQSKIPWVGPARAFKGYEDYWKVANRANLAYLPFNDVAEDGATPVAPPQRPQPPQAAQAYITGMQTAAEEMKMVSGQYDATMGAKGNETSGYAINQRQRQGDRATYHYIDQLANAIRYTGKILIDLIPKVYDRARVIRILGEDGKEESVQLDPSAQVPFQMLGDPAQQQPVGTTPTAQAVTRIFNPTIGKYDVVVDVGPQYQTRRQEAFNALTQIASQRPELMQVVGDLIMRAADFPMADELAERLYRMVPAWIKGEGPTPNEQQQAQQIQQLQALIQSLTQQLDKVQSDRAFDASKLSIDAHRADTERLKVVPPVDPAQLLALATDAAQQAIAQEIQPYSPPPQMAPPTVDRVLPLTQQMQQPALAQGGQPGGAPMQ
ncbi:portal protein [Burkholderia cenocepacia]|uniref:portal protein n=1 Tax=Burkholderia cenocepacia TaxID=95486 RepID=UPI0022378FBC|nr:portal protein [Burkholderia cenocepacia]MCW5141067.1 hypothetical protein [Burkholderia cenocepacia]